MASLNKVFLIGNLTRDPELRYTPSGAAVTDLGLAINRIYNTREGERREDTLFIDVTVWNRQAETCCQYLRKGRPIHVEGYLRMDSWDDRTTGEKRSKIKVEAERIQFLDGRRDEAGSGPGMAADDDYSASSPRPQRATPEARGTGNGPSHRSYGPGPAPSPTSRRPATAASDSDPDSPDEDIPF